MSGWNFGPVEEDSQSVEWVVRRFCEHFDYADGFTIDAGEFHPEKQLLRLDISKAAHQLNWRPAMPLSEALRFTADWYAAHLRARMTLKPRFARSPNMKRLSVSVDAEVPVDAVKTAEGRYL